MPINAGYEYMNAEKVYLEAKTLEEKIRALEEMIRAAPKHKSSENLLAELKTRLKKFREKQEKGRKTGKGKAGIKKEGFQTVLMGLPNSGKSSLLAALTNARPLISSHPFTTKEPQLGTMNYEGVKAQVIDVPSVGCVEFDIGLVNTADCVLLVVEKLEDLSILQPLLSRAHGSTLIVLTKIDRLSESELRKLDARCRSLRLVCVLTSAADGRGINELKRFIFGRMNVIRIYMKEPGKVASSIPGVLSVGSTVRDAAESILKGFSARVKETRVTGPSAKFANQKVGLTHVLKDRDVVEFKT